LRGCTAALSPKEKKAALAAIASGERRSLIGTHALVQEGVEFARLGLAVSTSSIASA
jgi:ATP-dependent DNA helicase RecG